MKNTLVLILSVPIVLSFTGCAYQPYNPNNPQEYIDYWCNPENHKNSLFERASKDPDVLQEIDPIKAQEQERACLQKAATDQTQVGH